MYSYYHIDGPLTDISQAIFASKSPSRVYETLISILYKYPWFATDYVSARERDALFGSTLHLLQCLMFELSKEKHDMKSSPLDVTTSLLQELASAMLVCVGFTDRQKAVVVDALHRRGYSGIATGEGANLRLGGQHPYCTVWPFNSLCVKPGVTPDLLSVSFASLLHSEANFTDFTVVLRSHAPHSHGQHRHTSQ